MFHTRQNIDFDLVFHRGFLSFVVAWTIFREEPKYGCLEHFAKQYFG